MILADPANGSHELIPYISRLGVACQKQTLGFGDFCFEGSGPTGRIYVGVERKTLHDMLHCIDDARYAGFQRGGMRQIYRFNFLALEGMWKPHYPGRELMQGNHKGAFWPCKYRSLISPYSKLYNYLISVALSGVPVLHSRDMEHTAVNIVELYHYFQKRWDAHTSMMETQLMPLAGITGRPSLVRRWVSQLEGFGVKLSENAESIFSSGIQLANADETEWVRIHGVSPRMAKLAVSEITGRSL